MAQHATNEPREISAQGGEEVVTLFTGGPDSSTLLAWEIENNLQPTPVYFDAGDQINVRELSVAEDIASRFDREVLTFDVSSPHSILPAGEVPFEHRPVIPFASEVLLSISIAYALQSGIPYVATALHYDDAQASDEYQPDFFEKLQELVDVVADEYGSVEIVTPFIEMEKSAVMELGDDLDVPLHRTRSCMDIHKLHCGTCPACISRRQAFASSDIEDKTIYRRSLPNKEYKE